MTKIDKARSLSKVGQYPATFDALLGYFDDPMIQSMTAEQLAVVLDALHSCSERGKRLALRDAINEGVIWDDRAAKLRRIEGFEFQPVPEAEQ